MDPQQALMDVLSGGLYAIGAAGINQGTAAINGYSSQTLYPFGYGAPGYATPYSLGMTPAQQSTGLGGLLLIGALVWLIVR